MILIFGGTTEGRLAIEVCEKAGKPFYYSTKTGRQDIEMHNGVHLSGAMTEGEMIKLCGEKEIRCIVDAAHPFAENLHKTIANVSLSTRIPVIRIERAALSCTYSETQEVSNFTMREGIVMCDGYEDAMRRMEKAGVSGLLALSGVNTIEKLKPFWQHHRTIFRILRREESLAIAERCGLPEQDLIFYDDSLQLPDAESEAAMMRELMRSVPLTAMLTKESGASGGFEAKVKAAMECGLQVFVVRIPVIPGSEGWTRVTGQYGLRRAIEHLLPDFFPLRTGFTTGACATAAVKAAAIALLFGDCSEEIFFTLPDGEVMKIGVDDVLSKESAPKGRADDDSGADNNADDSVKASRWAAATVIKPDNDDPDVTKGCRITAMVSIRKEDNDIRFLQGEGVGKVTLPGLGIPVGEPAINPTPRKMIEGELRQLADCGFNVTISVENGDEIAKRTFNEKVGVVGGISIIGTSGIVHPFSNEAFIESIRREMQVAKAIGCTEIVLVSGMKSERILREDDDALRYDDDEAVKKPTKRYYIHYGNFIGEALKAAVDCGFTNVMLGIMIGKAVKLAEGHLDTHSHKVQMNKDFLISIAPEHAESIAAVTMARELWGTMPKEFFKKLTQLCYDNCRKVFPDGQLNVRIIAN